MIIKGTQHKGCSCNQCRYGRGTKRGQLIRQRNERKLRRTTKLELKLKEPEEALIGHISTPYTD